jgi:hypothetical protein
VNLKSQKVSQVIYEIRVEGELGNMWSSWFEGLSIGKEIDEPTGQPITVLSGPFPDQPALHGVLTKIRDLNLTLISIKKSETK